MNTIYQIDTLCKEGKALREEGNFELALAKYRDALATFDADASLDECHFSRKVAEDFSEMVA
jgi:hypothetical protein